MAARCPLPNKEVTARLEPVMHFSNLSQLTLYVYTCGTCHLNRKPLKSMSNKNDMVYVSNNCTAGITGPVLLLVV